MSLECLAYDNLVLNGFCYRDAESECEAYFTISATFARFQVPNVTVSSYGPSKVAHIVIHMHVRSILLQNFVLDFKSL